MSDSEKPYPPSSAPDLGEDEIPLQIERDWTPEEEAKVKRK